MKKKIYVLAVILMSLFIVSCTNQTPKSRFNVTYLVEAEKQNLTPNEYEFTEGLKLPSFNKDGYFFLGWYDKEELSGEAIEEITRGSLGDKTFYGKVLKAYELTLEFNGGQEMDYEKFFHEEQSIELPPFSNKANHSFKGWYDNEEFLGEPVTTVPVGTKSDITYYAKFEVFTKTLTLDFAGGPEVDYDPIIPYDEEVILPTELYREHYEFAGWYSDKLYLGEKIDKIKKHTTQSIKLYAKWEIADSVFAEIGLPDSNEKIGSNITISSEIYDFYVEFDNQETDIISNKGILKRPYIEREITLTVKISDGYNITYKDYPYVVEGYKSLDSPIRSGYIYRDYFDADDYYFDNQEILYGAFAIANSDGNFSDSFIDSANNRYWGNVRYYLMPKAKERGIRVIMSVAPESDWRVFSTTEELRENFANNIVELINQHGFDGVDIDWETPRSHLGEDLLYTELMKIVHAKVKANNPHHLVTTAITGGSSQPPHYNLRNSGQYIDYINIMTYGMASREGMYQNALYHRQTFHNPGFLAGRPPRNANISDSIKIFNNTYNVPSSKLIIGLAFYGIKQMRTYDAETNTYSTWEKFGSGLGWINILYELQLEGQTRVFDEISQVPYIINDEGTIFISYEDPISIKLKAEYIIANGVAGMMYWEYGHDYENTLLKAMVENLPKS